MTERTKRLAKLNVIIAAFSILPVISLLQLYQMPVGSGVRPMDRGLYVLVLGPAAPLVVWRSSRFILRTTEPASGRREWVESLLLLLAVVLSLSPFCLSWWGFSWVIDARDLWLKP